MWRLVLHARLPREWRSKPAVLSRPPERPPPELGNRCAQGRRLDLVDNCFWRHLGDFGALANVRFAPTAVIPLPPIPLPAPFPANLRVLVQVLASQEDEQIARHTWALSRLGFSR